MQPVTVSVGCASRAHNKTDKSLARPGRKQATATEDFDWRNISTVYIYNKTHQTKYSHHQTKYIWN